MIGISLRAYVNQAHVILNRFKRKLKFSAGCKEDILTIFKRSTNKLFMEFPQEAQSHQRKYHEKIISAGLFWKLISPNILFAYLYYSVTYCCVQRSFEWFSDKRLRFSIPLYYGFTYLLVLMFLLSLGVLKRMLAVKSSCGSLW